MQTTIGTDMAKDDVRDTSTKRKNKPHVESTSLEGGEHLDVGELIGAVRSFLETAGSKAIESAKERPAITLAAAVGIGFVLGGGLSTRIGRMALLGAVELGLKQFSRAGNVVG